MTTDLRDEVLDRQLALALEELGGTQVPPDRRDAILARVHAATIAASRRRRRTAAAAVLLFGIAATVAVLAAMPSGDAHAPTTAPSLASHPLAEPAPAPAEPAAPAHPKGTDAADLAAMRSAEAMLAAEHRLAERIATGAIPGGLVPLPFASLRGWTYTNGVEGMPAAVRALDGTQVAMLGFMLPIDEVTDIAQFLLVESLWSCCYGTPPDIHGIVRVVMPPGRRTEYMFDPLLVTGTLRIGATVEDGHCVDVYQLHANELVLL